MTRIFIVGLPDTGKTTLISGIFKFLIELCGFNGDITGILKLPILQIDKESKDALITLFFEMSQGTRNSRTMLPKNLKFLINPRQLAAFMKNVNPEEEKMKEIFEKSKSPLEINVFDVPGEIIVHSGVHINSLKPIKSFYKNADKIAVLFDIHTTAPYKISNQIEILIKFFNDLGPFPKKTSICFVGPKKDLHGLDNSKFKDVLLANGINMMNVLMGVKNQIRYISLSVVREEPQSKRIRYAPEGLEEFISWLHCDQGC